jgi:hypothetical protein
VVHLNGDHVLLGAAEGNGDVGEVLDQLAWRRRTMLVRLLERRSVGHLSVDETVCRWEMWDMRTSGALDGHNPRANVNLHCRTNVSVFDLLKNDVSSVE